MNKILLASHGPLATAMKAAAELFTGPTDRIESICAYVDEASMDVGVLIDAWLASRHVNDRWVVITDIFGGSVNNEFMVRMADGGFMLIAGMNLGLVIELACGLDRLSLENVEQSVEQSRAGIVFCNNLATAGGEDEEF
ncbi:PTS sugar transporter subunit IIA [Collinsella vaginalis]|uniref:PTS sugar transporter subunit IIA n=1 Tax=Collinsella vaginalis TaxID=1870987 RepID=UPI000A26BE02|nr:hypothetical protein [Collinsella vaginalis]